MKIQKQFTIRKKIAKHGPNSIIVIPKLLQDELRPRMIVELNIKVLKGNEIDDKDAEDLNHGENENE